MVVMSRKKRPARLAGKDENSQAYWDEVLRAEGLAMDIGKPGHGKVVYVGNSFDVSALEEMQAGKNGRVKPAGSGPDKEGTASG